MMLSIPPHPLRAHLFAGATATTEIYTLSLHDALPICGRAPHALLGEPDPTVQSHPRHDLGMHEMGGLPAGLPDASDRKSTRLNSSHMSISYAVFCLKKKK